MPRAGTFGYADRSLIPLTRKAGADWRHWGVAPLKEATCFSRVPWLILSPMPVDSEGEPSGTFVGRAFQEQEAEILQGKLGEPFDLEVSIPIGDPPKPHKFDLVSKSGSIVCECKAFAWTVGGNAPSAKIATLREALFYLWWLPDSTRKIIVLSEARRPESPETLGTYFVRLNAHLLGDVSVVEVGEAESRALHNSPW